MTLYTALNRDKTRTFHKSPIATRHPWRSSTAIPDRRRPCLPRPANNELGALAYAILIVEGTPVSEETREAISSARTLAFDSQILVFEKEYQSLPSDLRTAFEQLDYFKEPFDDVLLRQNQRASRAKTSTTGTGLAHRI